jgi:hypothetical protein
MRIRHAVNDLPRVHSFGLQNVNIGLGDTYEFLIVFSPKYQRTYGLHGSPAKLMYTEDRQAASLLHLLNK